MKTPFELYAKETGPGWDHIVDPLIDAITDLGDVNIFQVKEKFGGLRVYVGGENYDNVAIAEELIKSAEAECWRTCEHCGEPGKLRGGGWLRTLCDVCHAKVEADRAARKALTDSRD